MIDWKRVVEQLHDHNRRSGGLGDAIRLCTAASRLPEGVAAVKVLEEYAATREQLELAEHAAAELKNELDHAHTALAEDGWGDEGWDAFRKWQDEKAAKS